MKRTCARLGDKIPKAKTQPNREQKTREPLLQQKNQEPTGLHIEKLGRVPEKIVEECHQEKLREINLEALESPRLDEK